MNPPPVAVSDYEARATAEDFGIGPYWESFRDMMIAAGVWKLSGESA